MPNVKEVCPEPSDGTVSKPGSWTRRKLRVVWAKRLEVAALALTLFIGLASDALAQEARVRGFFTRARDILVWVGPLVTIGCLFWGGANVLRERPAGKQWASAAIFLALTILSGLLQDWWR